MITDKPPKKGVDKEEYQLSDAIDTLLLPPAQPLRLLAGRLKEAMVQEKRREIESLCNQIAKIVSESLNVVAPKVKILGVRPLETKAHEFNELFGDYDLNTGLIRLWMRTAVQQKMTSFGTLLSTLCHEICHHLDVVHLNLPNTFHTRGFYERAGLLYHHVAGTPRRVLVWNARRDGTFQINWPATMRKHQ